MNLLLVVLYISLRGSVNKKSMYRCAKAERESRRPSLGAKIPHRLEERKFVSIMGQEIDHIAVYEMWDASNFLVVNYLSCATASKRGERPTKARA